MMLALVAPIDVLVAQSGFNASFMQCLINGNLIGSQRTTALQPEHNLAEVRRQHHCHRSTHSLHLRRHPTACLRHQSKSALLRFARRWFACCSNFSAVERMSAVVGKGDNLT